jgi:hypothetical protein
VGSEGEDTGSPSEQKTHYHLKLEVVTKTGSPLASSEVGGLFYCMQSIIILSHDDLISTRQTFYSLKESLEAELKGATNLPVVIINTLDFLNQICTQLDDQLSAIPTNSPDELHFPAERLSRIAKLCLGAVIVNGKKNIHIGIEGNNLVLTTT